MTTGSFKGKKAIVIGDSSGIGKATAKQLLIGGCTVYIVSHDQKKAWTLQQMSCGIMGIFFLSPDRR